MKCVQTAAVLHVSVGRFGKQTYRGAGAVLLLHTQVEFAVQVDVTRLPRELEHVEREVVGRSQYGRQGSNSCSETRKHTRC